MASDLSRAKLSNAKNLIQEQLFPAKLCRTTFPDYIALDPNRDCAEQGIDPETGDYIGP